MVFSINTLNAFLLSIDNKIIKNKDTEYYNLSASFDIETTSFYLDENNNNIDVSTYIERLKADKNYKADKRAIMYIWQLAIENNIIYGRTWEDFILLNKALNKKLGLYDKRKLIIYVHNLSYEFQFMKNYFKWLDIFATDERKPIYVENQFNIIFKCSYRLSGYSLNTVAKNLRKEKIKKLVGDLDYNLLRNEKTPLSNLEFEYCFNDVKIVVAFIRECIEDYGDISKIPLTQTGIVRRHVRKNCFKNKKYRYLINELTIEDSEYLCLNRAFAGGFTHASALYSTILCKDVTSYDFTSSYPTVLCSELFPMSKGEKIPNELITKEYFYNCLNNKCCLFDIVIYDIKPKYLFENIISLSKCYICENPIVNNGRIVSADKIAMSLTEIDFKAITQFYNFEKYEISNLYVYKKGYLPREIIESVLTLYSDKTTLKGVEGKEIEYMHAKQMLNSIYGMCVTSIIRDKVNYVAGKWETTPAILSEEMKKYNTDKNRFLFYQWGVWCTAYARYNLYSGILECKNDYIYADTDSIKIFNADKHKNYIDNYNKTILEKLRFMCNYYNFDLSLIEPITIKGEKKPLGVWDYDGHYKYFKSLGAKRYLTYDDDNNYHLTVAGLNKKIALPYIIKENNNNFDDIFNAFNDGLYIPENETGKNTHTYIDEEKNGVLVDYMGNSANYCAKSSVHLQASDYKLTLTNFYIEYIMNVQSVYN